MKIIYIFILFSLLFIYANDRGVRITSKMRTEQRVALVIGNNNYIGDRLPKLLNPINDARAIRDILKNKNFDVIYQEDGTLREMRKILSKFYKRVEKGGVGFFYFSGHGIEVAGQNYLIPIDAKIEDKSETEYEAVALGRITKRMQNAKNRLNIVVLDACRNDPFSRSAGKGGLSKTEPRGLFVSFSTGAGSVASDGKSGENGLFTKSLIKYMKQDINLADVFKKTRKEVFYSSKEKQFPAIYDQTIDGDFYFTMPSQIKEGNTEEKEKESYTRKVEKKSLIKTDKSKVKYEDKMDSNFDKFIENME